MTSTTQQPTKRPYAARLPAAERREQLLDTVLRVIAEQGVHKVSIDVVAREAGVTRPVVYGHFADSNALLRASLDRENEGALAQVRALLPGPAETESGSIPDVVVGMLDRFLHAVLEKPDRWRAILMVADSSTPAFRARLDRGRREAITGIEDLLAGADVGGDVPLLARVLLAVVVEAARVVLTEPEDFPPARVREFAEASLRRVLPG